MFGTIPTLILAQFIEIENVIAWVFVQDLICTFALFLTIFVGYLRRKTGEDYVWTWPALPSLLTCFDILSLILPDV